MHFITHVNDDVLAESGRDILVVDDNASSLVAIETALSPLGRTLVLARSGPEALGHLRERDFALIILDVAMPGMDGFETARQVRGRAPNCATPIIFVTDLAWQDEEMLRAYALGGVGFLAKPIRSEVLRAKAGVFLELQDLRRAQVRAHDRELALQRERFESELVEHQMRQLAETDRLKDEFLAILATELRNPLQPLLTAAELIDHDDTRPVPPRVREIIRRQVHHIGRLVDDLLDVARFQAGKLELRREPIAISSVVEEALASMRPVAEARGHDVIVRPGPSPLIFGDALRLVQVLTNIMSNAIKYTDPGGVVSVEWGMRDDQAFAQISDNGRGITAALLPKIFDMFVKDRVTDNGAGGLGLGLGLAKRLVELHGGSIHATSNGRGTGASFEVRIPIAAGETVARHASAPADTTRRPLRAVVVDDAVDLRELVADLLRMKGHEVTTVEDGPQAIAVICAQRPDVALIDIGLPVMDGYEVARTLRRDLPRDGLRLVAMTGFGQPADRATALDAGFDAHIVKPASANQILRAIYGE